MHKISEFYGMSIYMDPENCDSKPEKLLTHPNIIAKYDNYIGYYSIPMIKLIWGEFPPTGNEDIIDWITLNQDVLIKMYKTKNIRKIKPWE